MNFMEFQDTDFTKANKFVHRGKEFAMILVSKELRNHPGQDMIRGMDQLMHVSFDMDCAPKRDFAEDGPTVLGTVIVCNLNKKPNPAGETFGDFFRYIGAGFDKLDDAEGRGIRLSFVLFDIVHTLHFVPWAEWAEIEKFWSEDRQRREDRVKASS